MIVKMETRIKLFYFVDGSQVASSGHVASIALTVTLLTAKKKGESLKSQYVWYNLITIFARLICAY